jgi:hypothetical protein
MKSKIEDFFSKYESRVNTALITGEVDPKEAASAFSNCFIESNPNEVICGKNNEEFLEMIPKGYQYYRSIGTTAMKILSMDINRLDEFHYSAKIQWDSYYKKENEVINIKFDVIYLLRINGDTPEIFAYITGDEEKALQEKGLIK